MAEARDPRQRPSDLETVVSRSHAVFVAMLAALAFPQAAAADQSCAQLKGFWLDLTPSEQGYLVPITIAGTPRLFLLEMGDAFAKLDRKIVEAEHFPLKSLPRDIEVHDGHLRLTEVAVVPTIQIGVLPREQAEVLAEPHQAHWGMRASGVVGLNIFAPLDIELDLAHDKLGLFLPEHCPFRPYWRYDVLGSTPFKTDPTGTIVLPMMLDGRRVEASISTARSITSMPSGAARALFRLDEAEALRHVFGTLSAGDVTIAHPQIGIYPDKVCGGEASRWYNGTHSENGCAGGGDLYLGLSTLRQLRLFFSFKEKTVYFTPAEPAATAAPAPPG